MGKIKRLLPIFFALSSCSSSSPWLVSHLQGTQKGFDSSRLIYPTPDIVNGVAVEMIYSKNSLRTYVAVHSQAIPPLNGNTKEAQVTLKVFDQTFQSVAKRHQGGQRALLSPDLQQILIENLLNGKRVTIELQGYSTTLDPNQFKEEYHKLRKAPLNIPFQFPFKLS